ncbi:MAG: hypothetical protein FD123_3434 [Bacteroidetes bacterium]|nr:MAG: hypothetical protein FD123_3434 [Bacteroidota bacterium]
MKLELGHKSDFEIRREIHGCAGKTDLRILYMSDLHFNRYSGKIAAKLINAVSETNPDILLLGGDYIDSRKGLPHLEKLLDTFSGREHVFAVAGNHDYYFGIDAVKKLVTKYNISWLEKETAHFTIRGVRIQVDGNRIGDTNTETDLRLLCLHKPIALKKFAGRYAVCFAGHLHGSQFVFHENEHGLFPGRFFYRWNILRVKSGNCSYFISKGLGDSLPIRYNCRKDVILVHVNSENKQFEIRPLQESDSIEELTQLLHLAYSKLAEQGFRYLASHQDTSVTRRRVEKGICFVAVAENKIIGTLTCYEPGRAGGHPWYARADVSSYGQFAVHPDRQAGGIGSALIRHAETLAAKQGAKEITVDTAEGAAELIRFYEKRGYRFVDHAQWTETNYRSVLLSKKLSG